MQARGGSQVGVNFRLGSGRRPPLWTGGLGAGSGPEGVVCGLQSQVTAFPLAVWPWTSQLTSLRPWFSYMSVGQVNNDLYHKGSLCELNEISYGQF